MKIFFWIYFWQKYFSPRSSLRSPTEMITDRGTDLLSFVSNIRLDWIIVIVITDMMNCKEQILYYFVSHLQMTAFCWSEAVSRAASCPLDLNLSTIWLINWSTLACWAQPWTQVILPGDKHRYFCRLNIYSRFYIDFYQIIPYLMREDAKQKTNHYCLKHCMG